jgi:hypothetical protein
VPGKRQKGRTGQQGSGQAQPSRSKRTIIFF